MKEVTKEVLIDASNRLLFTMSDSEFNLLLEEFEIIKKQMDLMGHIEGVDDVAPMTFPYEVEVSYLREDTPKEVISKEEALKNAKNVKDGQIKLPKVV